MQAQVVPDIQTNNEQEYLRWQKDMKHRYTHHHASSCSCVLSLLPCMHTVKISKHVRGTSDVASMLLHCQVISGSVLHTPTKGFKPCVTDCAHVFASCSWLPVGLSSSSISVDLLVAGGQLVVGSSMIRIQSYHRLILLSCPAVAVTCFQYTCQVKVHLRIGEYVSPSHLHYKLFNEDVSSLCIEQCTTALVCTESNTKMQRY